MGGQESDGGERLERSVGDGESKLNVLLPVDSTLQVEVTLHAELVLLDDGLVEAIDGQGDAQAKRLLSHFDSLDLMRWFLDEEREERLLRELFGTSRVDIAAGMSLVGSWVGALGSRVASALSSESRALCEKDDVGKVADIDKSAGSKGSLCGLRPNKLPQEGCGVSALLDKCELTWQFRLFLPAVRGEKRLMLRPRGDSDMNLTTTNVDTEA